MSITNLCVLRLSDRAIIAQWSAGQRDIVPTVRRVAQSPAWASLASDKLALDDGGDMIYALLDGSRAYFLSATSMYPSRHVYDGAGGAGEGALGALQRRFTDAFHVAAGTCKANGLGSELLRSVAAQFNDVAALDRLGRVSAQVAAVASVMRLAIQNL